MSLYWDDWDDRGQIIPKIGLIIPMLGMIVSVTPKSRKGADFEGGISPGKVPLGWRIFY